MRSAELVRSSGRSLLRQLHLFAMVRHIPPGADAIRERVPARAAAADVVAGLYAIVIARPSRLTSATVARLLRVAARARVGPGVASARSGQAAAAQSVAAELDAVSASVMVHAHAREHDLRLSSGAYSGLSFAGGKMASAQAPQAQDASVLLRAAALRLSVITVLAFAVLVVPTVASLPVVLSAVATLLAIWAGIDSLFSP